MKLLALIFGRLEMDGSGEMRNGLLVLPGLVGLVALGLELAPVVGGGGHDDVVHAAAAGEG